MKIIFPKRLVAIDPSHGPLFFLAGPARGGGDWQTRCCYEIEKNTKDFYAAIPYPPQTIHPLNPYREIGEENHFERQLQWERYYLDIAAISGCIIFWLPCESTTNPRTGSDPYAMDTRGELGEWRGCLRHNPNYHVVIGAEQGFPGLSQIQRNFNAATKSDFPIYGSLGETVIAAIEKARQ
ncbi:hypothetical protein EB052_01450 [bacterium]|nr:hypothetical protein [bacterium]